MRPTPSRMIAFALIYTLCVVALIAIGYVLLNPR